MRKSGGGGGGKSGGGGGGGGKSSSSAMQCKPAAGNSGSGNLSRSQVGQFSTGPHGSAGKSVGSHASAGKPGGSHSSVGKSSSSVMQCKPAAGNSGSGNLSRSQVGHFSADPKSLHFTQESIKGSFSKGPMSGVKLHDAVAEVKAGSSRPASSGLQVHRGQNGELWCENNRSLYVAREAGVPSGDVKVNLNDLKSRHLVNTSDLKSSRLVNTSDLKSSRLVNTSDLKSSMLVNTSDLKSSLDLKSRHLLNTSDLKSSRLLNLSDLSQGGLQVKSPTKYK